MISQDYFEPLNVSLKLPLLLTRTYKAHEKILTHVINKTCKLSIEKCMVIYILGNKGALTIDELMYHEMKEHNSVSALLERMSNEGLVRKKRDKVTRKVIVTITKKGKEALDPRDVEKALKEIFDVLSQGEREELDRILTKLISHEIIMLNRLTEPQFK
jgi:DNA-binding MarR family transcriptional regulator